MPVPVACPTLCLLLEFDLSAVPCRDALPARDHGAAAARACAETGLLPGEQVAARGRLVAEGTLRAVQQEPFDHWALSEDGPVKFDFCYELSSAAAPRLVIRVLTDLRAADGVTAVRLALHALEAVEAEGGEAAVALSAASFPQNPPVTASCRRCCCLAWLILRVVLDVILAPYRLLWRVLTCQTVQPNTPEGWLWYHCARSYQPAEIALFATEASMFKEWQLKVDEWRKEIGLSRGFFYLLNYSPQISPGIVRDLAQLGSVGAKLEHALARPAPPQLGPNLHVLHLLLSRTVMFNNYGRHHHRFQAVPTGFCWDWLNFPATLCCAFAICINGRLLVGLRGEAGFVEHGRRRLAAATAAAAAAAEAGICGGAGGRDAPRAGGFGEARRLTQIIHYPKQGHNRFAAVASAPEAKDMTSQVPLLSPRISEV